MLLTVRDEDNRLLAKDILDIDFDMCVEKDPLELTPHYYVKVNRWYRLDETFQSQEDAEDRMLEIVRDRNMWERELREY